MHKCIMDKTFDIRAERIARKISQAEIAGALGVNQSTIARWEDRQELVKPFVMDAIKRVIKKAPRPR